MPESLNAETDHERTIRDAEAEELGPPLPVAEKDDWMGVSDTLRALKIEAGHTILEMGPGTGRFTRLLAPLCGLLVGIDISRSALGVTSRLVEAQDNVLLVQGDATTPIPAPGEYDRVLGTLTSNLPDQDSRMANYAVAALALKPEGRFVFSTHHYGLRARMEGEAIEGRYTSDGIYRRLLTPAEVKTELSPFFRRVRVRPINVVLPFARRLGLHSIQLDRLAQRVPGLRGFGHLLLVEATGPVKH